MVKTMMFLTMYFFVVATAMVILLLACRALFLALFRFVANVLRFLFRGHWRKTRT